MGQLLFPFLVEVGIDNVDFIRFDRPDPGLCGKFQVRDLGADRIANGESKKVPSP